MGWKAVTQRWCCRNPARDMKCASGAAMGGGATVAASRVADGVCDCCDGSDEAHGHCADRCAELRGLAAAHLAAVERGEAPASLDDVFQALAETGINVEMISTSEIRISVVTRVDDSAKAVQALHSAFGLDADGEAVVYAGSGR